MLAAMTPLGTGSALVYRVVRALSQAAVGAYFGRLDVSHSERLPSRGPVLVVANHPSSLTDVLILGVALPRRLHFLAHSGLFHPWIRGAFLRLAGTLAVYRREDEPTLTFRNEDTFRACHTFFDEDGVVVIFPEGTSQTDRQVQRLKTGAARLALGYETLPGRTGRLTVLPVGLHFVERTAFRSDIVLSAGRPVDLAPYVALSATDPDGAVRALTEKLQAILERLILHVPDAEMTGFVRDLQLLYLEDLRLTMPGAQDLTLARGVVECVEHFNRTDPARLYAVWRRVAAYRAKLAALNLRDQALRERLAGRMVARTSARLLTLGAAGILPALAGALVHYVPYKLSDLVGGLFARDPTRISFGRIVTGAVVFPLTYAAFGAALLRAGASPRTIAAVLTACVPLGFVALAYFRWVRRERHRLRLGFLVATNARLVARLRLERRAVIRLLRAAESDYRAATGVGGDAGETTSGAASGDTRAVTER